MFDFDAGKLVVIGVVALVVIGPKDLPRVLRHVGQAVGKMRRMAGEFQSQFMDAMRDAEIADMKSEMEKVAQSAKLDVAFDPVHDVRNEIGGAVLGEGAATPAAGLAAPAAHGDLGAAEASAAALTADTMADGGLVAAGVAPGTPDEAGSPKDAKAAGATRPAANHLA